MYYSVYLIVFNTSTLIDFLNSSWVLSSACDPLAGYINPQLLACQTYSGVTLAHELGHYFGLRHVLGYNPLIPGPKQTLSCLSRSVKGLIDLPHEIAIAVWTVLIAKKLKIDSNQYQFLRSKYINSLLK